MGALLTVALAVAIFAGHAHGNMGDDLAGSEGGGLLVMEVQRVPGLEDPFLVDGIAGVFRFPASGGIAVVRVKLIDHIQTGVEVGAGVVQRVIIALGVDPQIKDGVFV